MARPADGELKAPSGLAARLRARLAARPDTEHEQAVVRLAISALLIVISAVVLLSVKVMTRWRSGSDSLTPFVASPQQPI